MGEKVRVVVYLDPESREELCRAASAQGRSLSGFLRWLAVNWVKGGSSAEKE